MEKLIRCGGVNLTQENCIKLFSKVQKQLQSKYKNSTKLDRCNFGLPIYTSCEQAQLTLFTYVYPCLLALCLYGNTMNILVYKVSFSLTTCIKEGPLGVQFNLLDQDHCCFNFELQTQPSKDFTVC